MLANVSTFTGHFMDKLKGYLLPPSKHHQLLIDVRCVLLGVKPAFLVDYIKPDAEKLQLFVQEQLSLTHDQILQASNSKCNPSFCILTIKEDVLLMNVTMLNNSFQSITTQQGEPNPSAPTSDNSNTHYVYIDVTKGLKQPNLISESENYDLFSKIETQLAIWFKKFQTVIKTNATQNPVTHTQQSSNVLRSSTEQSEKFKQSAEIFSYVPIISCDAGAELNVCTLFGRLLGYPVVYWFDTEVGYSLDMEELVCYSISVCEKTDSLKSSQSLHLNKVCSAHFSVP